MFFSSLSRAPFVNFGGRVFGAIGIVRYVQRLASKESKRATSNRRERKLKA